MTRAVEHTFSTFCHISEYGDHGYQDLHTLVAISQPLNLWAPSSALIRHVSRIPPKDFIRYVDQGFIRILARDRWLTDRRFRDEHPWSAARWDREIDDALRSILRNDQGLEGSQRRVVSAPPEDGERHAMEYLESNPLQITYWNRAFRSRNAARKVPVGTLETATRYTSEGPAAVAKWILRDAFNHADAFALSGARAPLFLSPSDLRFIRLITNAPPTTGVPATSLAPSAATASSQARIEHLARQLIDVLRHLDIHAGRRSLDAFIRGEGRQELLVWIDAVCNQYQYHPRREIDGVIIRELRRQLSRARLQGPFGPFRARTALPAVVGAVDLAATTISFVLSPGEPLNAIGMAAGVFGIGNGLAQQMGWVPSTFDGPQWPFLYSYASRAKKSRLHRMIDTLAMYRT
ncbi:hypothetical protein AB0E08_38410 [Streptomyces sp. NPDC048281]|uniref:hypothetical protein n=1 Tax=Streptomyces sp. NPDC048281 TaxID=3154715 RepID=UPI003443F609